MSSNLTLSAISIQTRAVSAKNKFSSLICNVIASQPTKSDFKGMPTPDKITQEVMKQPLRLGNLDLLRLIAALMVVVYHYTFSNHVDRGINPLSFPELAPFTQSGWAGVSLFFMISGFVIAWSAEKSNATGFAVSRAARLYPAFLFCLMATSLTLLFAGMERFPEYQISLGRFIANMTMAPVAFKQQFVDAVYWSILVEATFYGWVALFIATGLFQKRQLEIMAVWLALTFLNEFVLSSALFNKLFITRYACYFVLGILCYRIFVVGRRPNWAELALGTLALLLTLKSDHHVHSWMQEHYAGMLPWNPVASFVKTLIFLALINLAIRTRPVLPTAWCVTLGGLTYPLYLLHNSIGMALFNNLDGMANRWVLLIVVTALMLAFSYAVFRWIEPPGRRLIMSVGKQFENKTLQRLKKAGAIDLRGLKRLG